MSGRRFAIWCIRRWVIEALSRGVAVVRVTLTEVRLDPRRYLPQCAGARGMEGRLQPAGPCRNAVTATSSALRFRRCWRALVADAGAADEIRAVLARTSRAMTVWQRPQPYQSA
jgi:hypothetical protein